MRMLVVPIIVVTLSGAVSCLHAQGTAPEKNVETFMRAKLLHSQKVLEGLTTDDLKMVAKHAQDMSLLSLASTWQVFETPEYARRSNEFRRAVDDLTRAAKEENLDGATLSYVNVTLKCVDCHKYVRSVRQVKVERPRGQGRSSIR